jgi:aspartate aminotransferase-like enzyme
MKEPNDAHLWLEFDDSLSAIPGGTSLHPRVMRNMQRPYVNPWSTEFQSYYDETLELLKGIYNTRQDVLMMMGPVRLVMDAVMNGLVGPSEKSIVVGVNGQWSWLFTQMIQFNGGIPLCIEAHWGDPLDPARVDQELKSLKSENLKALVVTHIETSTGVTNPVAELGEVARRHGLLFVVDAAQSLGGEEVRTDDWGIDFCLAGNPKCMSAPAGLAYVAISERGWQALEARQATMRGWYTNLLLWRQVWLRRQAGYFTFPTSLVFGLRAALDMMYNIGLPELYQRYARVARAIRSAVKSMGLRLVAEQSRENGETSENFCANTATAIYYPPGVSHADFSRLMHETYQISVAGTYGELADKVFRVGPTGLLQIAPSFTLHLISCMGLAFRRLGYQVDIDKALAAADQAL